MYSLVCDHEHTVSYGSPREVVHVSMDRKDKDPVLLPMNQDIVFEIKAWLMENLGYPQIDSWLLIWEKAGQSTYLRGIQFYEKKHAMLFMLRWNGIMLSVYAGDITEI